MTSWYHCNSAGAIVVAGMAPSEHDAAQQIPGSGRTLHIVPDGLIGGPFDELPDFSLLRAYLQACVDKEAGAFRARFITDVPGQAQTYEKKEREATGWAAGDDVAHPEKYPFMIAEAAVRGISVAAVRAEIMAQVTALTPLAALIEGHRIAAKQAVGAATTLPAIMAAAVVDWEALLS